MEGELALYYLTGHRIFHIYMDQHQKVWKGKDFLTSFFFFLVASCIDALHIHWSFTYLY